MLEKGQRLCSEYLIPGWATTTGWILGYAYALNGEPRRGAGLLEPGGPRIRRRHVGIAPVAAHRLPCRGRVAGRQSGPGIGARRRGAATGEDLRRAAG